MGVTGLIIAGIFAASMSTLSSCMNSVATLVSVDFYERFSKRSTPEKSMRLAEWITGIAGIIGGSFLLFRMFGSLPTDRVIMSLVSPRVLLREAQHLPRHVEELGGGGVAASAGGQQQHSGGDQDALHAVGLGMGVHGCVQITPAAARAPCRALPSAPPSA